MILYTIPVVELWIYISGNQISSTLCTVKVTGELSIPVAKKAKPDANRVECSFAMDVGQGQYCKVKTDDLITGDCTKENEYGFKKGKPCILIKLNKIYGWKPEPQEVKILT